MSDCPYILMEKREEYTAIIKKEFIIVVKTLLKRQKIDLQFKVMTII